MTMRVLLTEDAVKDVRAISAYIALDKPVRALSFIGELIESCQEIGHMPTAYTFVPRYKNKGIRRKVYQRYLIFYRVKAEQVEILRIVNGAIDMDSLLFSEEYDK